MMPPSSIGGDIRASYYKVAVPSPDCIYWLGACMPLLTPEALQASPRLFMYLFAVLIMGLGLVLCRL